MGIVLVIAGILVVGCILFVAYKFVARLTREDGDNDGD